MQGPTLLSWGSNAQLNSVRTSFIKLYVCTVVRAIICIHLHESTGGCSFLGLLVNDFVGYSQIWNEVTLCVTEVVVLEGVNICFEVEACFCCRQAHTCWLHVYWLEVHHSHVEWAYFLVLANWELFEACTIAGGIGLVIALRAGAGAVVVGSRGTACVVATCCQAKGSCQNQSQSCC